MDNKIKNVSASLFVFFVLFLLYVGSLYNYLLFHSLVEIFSILIAFTVFIIAWNSEKYLKNNYIIVIGIAYLFIGSLDLFHTLSYKGMQIFTEYDYYANQLWIASRYFESIVLFVSFGFLMKNKKINKYIVFINFFVLTTLILLAVFVWKIFPICFVEGVGLTPFKIISEYIISFILLLSIGMLLKLKKSFDDRIRNYLLLSMVFSIISELAFTIYIDNYGLSNLVGHYFKIFSFYLIYRAIIVKGIQEPYDIIFREMKQAQEKLNDQNEVLKDLAVLDGLTGLFNHRYIYEVLDKEIKRNKRYPDNFSFIMLDIDYFKKVNDVYGHIEGDKVLKTLAEILKDNVRETDVVGRYGGEEFAVILLNTEINQAYIVADKIRKSVESHNFDQGIKITISLGVEEYSGEAIGELIEKADKKLYEAKRMGRNRTV